MICGVQPQTSSMPDASARSASATHSVAHANRFTNTLLRLRAQRPVRTTLHPLSHDANFARRCIVIRAHVRSGGCGSEKRARHQAARCLLAPLLRMRYSIGELQKRPGSARGSARRAAGKRAAARFEAHLLADPLATPARQTRCGCSEKPQSRPRKASGAWNNSSPENVEEDHDHDQDDDNWRPLTEQELAVE
jgi:hypothetical protein